MYVARNIHPPNPKVEPKPNTVVLNTSHRAYVAAAYNMSSQACKHTYVGIQHEHMQTPAHSLHWSIQASVQSNNRIIYHTSLRGARSCHTKMVMLIKKNATNNTCIYRLPHVPCWDGYQHSRASASCSTFRGRHPRRAASRSARATQRCVLDAKHITVLCKLPGTRSLAYVCTYIFIHIHCGFFMKRISISYITTTRSAFTHTQMYTLMPHRVYHIRSVYYVQCCGDAYALCAIHAPEYNL